MGSFQVQPTELAHADLQLSAAAEHSRAALASLRHAADSALAGWHGVAAVAFRAGWADWLRATSVMIEALDEISRALGRSGIEYAAAEDAVRVSTAQQ